MLLQNDVIGGEGVLNTTHVKSAASTKSETDSKSVPKDLTKTTLRECAEPTFVRDGLCHVYRLQDTQNARRFRRRNNNLNTSSPVGFITTTFCVCIDCHIRC